MKEAHNKQLEILRAVITEERRESLQAQQVPYITFILIIEYI
jgi:hypothetical protein